MKTLWFRDTYLMFVLSSKFRPRVIPMLYSFYLIVYLICISYFILSFSFFMSCCFFVCKLHIGFSFIIDIMGDFILCLVVLVIRIGIILSLTLCVIFRIMYFFFLCCFGFYDNIRDIHYLLWWWFSFLCVVCDHWLYVIIIIIDLW